MFSIGSKLRLLSGQSVGNEQNNPKENLVSGFKNKDDVVKRVIGYKSRPSVMTDESGEQHNVHARTSLTPPIVDKQGNAISSRPNVISGKLGGDLDPLSTSAIGNKISAFNSNSAQIQQFNPVVDDLSKGTVAEDWIPKDTKGQNRMFRMMFSRGAIEGAVVETIAEMAWSDFDIVGITDPKILDIYYSAKESVNVEHYLSDITKEFLVLGRVTLQMIMNQSSGIFTDILIHDSDYIKVTPIPRTGYMPMIDLLPSPEIQNWARSRDPRALASQKDIPSELMQKFSSGSMVPLDPLVTCYIPRKAYFNDMIGTSFYVRNIPLWGLEKSLINATLTGHRRRSGPISHIKVGSESHHAEPEEIDAVVEAFLAAEEDSVSSIIGTHPEVEINQIRGGSGDMWKWSDEWAFLQEAKLRMFGFSEDLVSGTATVENRLEAMTIFMERVKAHRNFITEHFLMQKFFRSIAHIHEFKRVSTAELSHRIRIKEDDRDLILPDIHFHKQLDPVADMTRVELYNAMEEHGLPVTMRDWSQTLGWGDPASKLIEQKEDLKIRVKTARVFAIRAKIDAVGGMGESNEVEDLSPEEAIKKIQEIEKEIESLPFGDSNSRIEDDLTKSAVSKEEMEDAEAWEESDGAEMAKKVSDDIGLHGEEEEIEASYMADVPAGNVVISAKATKSLRRRRLMEKSIPKGEIISAKNTKFNPDARQDAVKIGAEVFTSKVVEHDKYLEKNTGIIKNGKDVDDELDGN